MANRMIDNKELVEKVKKDSSSDYQRFASDRTEIDNINTVADAMYACMQNRSIMSTEGSKGMNTGFDQRANVGSSIFHRQVNTLAGQLVNVLSSSRDWWEYSTIRNPVVPGSDLDSEELAIQNMILSRYTRKIDDLDTKIMEWAVNHFKLSNTYAMITQKQCWKKVRYKVPVTKEETMEDGEIVSVVVGEQEVEKDILDVNHPSITFPNPDSIFLDRYIPDIQQQNCVIIASLVSRAELFDEVVAGWLDEDAYNELTEKDAYNGSENSAQRQREHENREQTYSPTNSSLFMRWDIYRRLQINGDKEDTTVKPQLYWITIVGNTIADGKILRFERNPEPDDEIPIKDLHVYPDKIGSAYHTTTAEVVRSAYSADCTLLNMALDNIAVSVDPPLMVVDGRHRIDDFSYIKGQRWSVDDISVIKEFETKDMTQNISALRQQVQEDIKKALNTDPSMMGEYAGARTSASEFMGVSKGTMIPNYIIMSYTLNQLLPWMARKHNRYWQIYGDPSQVFNITDENKKYEIVPAKIAGQFDIEINILDQISNDAIARNELMQAINMIGSIPALQQSQYHTVNFYELLKQWLETNKSWKPSKIIENATGTEAESVAKSRIDMMLNSGVYSSPGDGESYSIQLRVAQAEKLRWNGLEGIDDKRVKNIPLLDRYISELKSRIQGGAAPAASISQQTPGQLSGNTQAAAIGSLQPQQ